MKKILLAALVAGLMSVSAFATDGTVDRIQVMNDGTVKLRLKKADDSLTNILPIVASGDALKSLTAVALTAKTTGALVTADYGTVDGVSGWTSFTMK